MATKDQKKMAAAFRKAAKIMEEGGYAAQLGPGRFSCCHVLWSLDNHGTFGDECGDVLAEFYKEVSGAYMWWGGDDQDSRVIALCLAADVIEGGGL